jgi:hypothetical protein
MEKEKTKVLAQPVVNKSKASLFFSPTLLKVATLIEADDPSFVPVYDKDYAYATLVANSPNGIYISSGGMDDVDCGFSIELPPGYRINVESILGGVLVALNSRVKHKQRMSLVVSNVRSEMLRIKHLQAFAKISLEPVYIFDWIINDSRSNDSSPAD